MNFTVTGTTFLQRLEEMKSRYAAAPSSVSGVLRVPEEHKWWYFQEMGWPAGYPIFPVNKTKLAWTDAEGKHVVYNVHSWGSSTPDAGRARHFVLSAMPEIRQQAIDLAQQVLQQGDPEVVRIMLLEGVLPAAKDLILQNVEETLPNARAGSGEKGDSPGKLGGRTAAEVLAEVITIEED